MDSKPAANERYRIDETYTADIGFEAFGETVETCIAAAGEAVMRVMVPDLDTIRDLMKRQIEIVSESLEMLLFDFLQELIFYKDADQLLLRVPEIRIEPNKGGYRLRAEAIGEILDRQRHELNVDVKAVTMHDFELKPTAAGWRAVVVLDI